MLPIESDVPPTELKNPLSLEVSFKSLQQEDKVVTLSLINIFESYHSVLWSEHHLAKSSSLKTFHSCVFSISSFSACVMSSLFRIDIVKTDSPRSFQPRRA